MPSVRPQTSLLIKCDMFLTIIGPALRSTAIPVRWVIRLRCRLIVQTVCESLAGLADLTGIVLFLAVCLVLLKPDSARTLPISVVKWFVL